MHISFWMLYNYLQTLFDSLWTNPCSRWSVYELNHVFPNLVYNVHGNLKGPIGFLGGWHRGVPLGSHEMLLVYCFFCLNRVLFRNKSVTTLQAIMWKPQFAGSSSQWCQRVARSFFPSTSSWGRITENKTVWWILFMIFCPHQLFNYFSGCFKTFYLCSKAKLK